MAVITDERVQRLIDTDLEALAALLAGAIDCGVLGAGSLGFGISEYGIHSNLYRETMRARMLTRNDMPEWNRRMAEFQHGMEEKNGAQRGQG